MLPKHPYLKTNLFIYEVLRFGQLVIRVHRESPEWAHDRLPTVEEVTSDLVDTAADPNRPDAERAMAMLMNGIYRMTLVNNGQDIVGHRVQVEIVPDPNDRWEDNLTSGD